MAYKNSEITPIIEDGLLASRRNAVPKTIPVSVNTTNADGGTLLPIGMVLVLVTDEADPDAGLYREFNDAAVNGQQLEGDAMVLAHRLDLTQAGDRDSMAASAYITAQLKRSKVIVPATFDWANVPRLILWPRQA